MKQAATPDVSQSTATTYVAAGWALLACHAAFVWLLVRHSIEPALGALFWLVAAWAALDRKRWGRLALAGMSSAVLLAAAALALALAHRAAASPLLQYTRLWLHACAADCTAPVGILLVLALCSACWLFSPVAAAEFGARKAARLAKAQRMIALVVVAFWLVTIARGAGSMLRQRGSAPGCLAGCIHP